MSTPTWTSELFAAIDAKDTKRFLSFLTPHAAFRFGSAPQVIGHEAIAAAVDGFFAGIRSSTHVILDTWTEARHVICRGEVTYTRLDSRVVAVPFVDVFLMQDGLIAEYLIYIDIAPLFAP